MPWVLLDIRPPCLSAPNPWTSFYHSVSADRRDGFCAGPAADRKQGMTMSDCRPPCARVLFAMLASASALLGGQALAPSPATANASNGDCVASKGVPAGMGTDPHGNLCFLDRDGAGEVISIEDPVGPMPCPDPDVCLPSLGGGRKSESSGRNFTGTTGLRPYVWPERAKRSQWTDERVLSYWDRKHLSQCRKALSQLADLPLQPKNISSWGRFWRWLGASRHQDGDRFLDAKYAWIEHECARRTFEAEPPPVR
jgi:hypothetical protein